MRASLCTHGARGSQAKFVDAKNAEFSEENLASEIHYMQRVGSHPNIVEYKAGYKGSNTYDLVMERMCAPLARGRCGRWRRRATRRHAPRAARSP